MIIGRPISSSVFAYYAREKTFSIEVSDVKGFPFCGRLYNDACDEGFVLVSHKTGKSQPYFLNQTIRNDFGEDVAGWEFLPAEPVLPGAKGTKVIVFND